MLQTQFSYHKKLKAREANMPGTGEDDRKDKNERWEKNKKAGSWKKEVPRKLRPWASSRQTERAQSAVHKLANRLLPVNCPELQMHI